MKKALRHPKADAAARQRFRETLRAHEAREKDIVYIDESGFSRSMPRLHGYAPRGRRCFDTHDWGARTRTNAVGALVGASLLTVALFDATINADTVHAWLARELLPRIGKPSVIVMDNASFHKRPDIREIIEAAGHVLEFLPPYSPDLNPSERKWAQAKARRRKTGHTLDQIFANLF